MLSSLSSTTTKSLGNILPSAAAATLENTKLTSTKGDCPISDEFGVVSDEFCSPIMTSDVSTMDMDPAEVYLKVQSLGNGDNFEGMTDDKNPKINLRSNLGKYLVFCGQRQVNYGYADASVATSSLINSFVGTLDQNEIYNGSVSDTEYDLHDHGITGGMSFIEKIIRFLAYIFTIWEKDAYDAVDSVKSALTEIANAEWISGLNCVNVEKNKKWDTEMKYYQRYLEDQGIMEAMGVVKKSSLEIALDEWYEENPIDDSYEGVLAYFSGHTKAEVQLALDYIDYQDALAQYNPTKMAPLSPEEEPSSILFDANNFTFIQMQEPLISRAAEFQSEVALREHKRAVYQSI